MRRFTLMVWLVIAVVTTSVRAMAQCDGNVSVSTRFNSTPIYGGIIWFSSSLAITGTPTYPLTIYFTHQSISSPAFSVTVPDAKLILDPSYTTATTEFNGTVWITTAPPNDSGNYFISGNIDTVGTISGGLSPVTWNGTFTASRPGVSLAWHWGAAMYSRFTSMYHSIKASDCSSCSIWRDNLPAGTPEGDRFYVFAGATGGDAATGSFNFPTGHYTAADSLMACETSAPPSVSVGATATTLCAGNSITCTATAFSGGATPSFQWKKNGVNVGTNSTTYTTRDLSNNDTITVTLTSSDPMASPATVVSTPLVFTVNNVPDPVTITGGSSLCAGGTLTLTPSRSGGVWNSGDLRVMNVSSSGVVTTVSTGRADIYYRITNSCGEAMASQSVIVTNGFTISGTLTSPTCNGYTNGSVLTSVTPRRGHTYTYTWSNGSTSYGLWGVGAGTYSLTATNETGCSQTATYTVAQPAALASTYSVTDDYGYGGDNGAIYYGLSGGTWPYTYSWSNGATTQNITGLPSGTYVVTATDANSCNITNWFSVRDISSGGRASSTIAGTNMHAAEASAFPNPFSSETLITFSAPNDGNTLVEVISPVTGEKVATIFNEDTRAGQQYSCKLLGEHLAAGVYLYNILCANRSVYTGRIVLTK